MARFDMVQISSLLQVRKKYYSHGWRGYTTDKGIEISVSAFSFVIRGIATPSVGVIFVVDCIQATGHHAGWQR
ncbi:MAG TPA: hypothetical protein VKH44_10260 [Pirellulaceae bacterium]|nr:hypothetical protein [Pirellulaceae bacterium]